MANKPRGRRRGRSRNFQAWPVSENLALGTLTDTSVISATLLALAQEVHLISADLIWTIRGATAGEGPILVGLANGDLSTTEIGEAIDASPTSQSAIVELEQASRPVRKVGHIAILTGTGDNQLNDGVAIRTKIQFPIANDTNLDFFARNESGGTLTTGQVLEIVGTVYGRWK